MRSFKKTSWKANERNFVLSAFSEVRPNVRYGCFNPSGVVAEGDRVSILSIWRGTHQAEFLGVPPTGKQVTFTAFGLCRFADGKIVEYTFLGDMLGVLQQFGAVPAPGQSEQASPT